MRQEHARLLAGQVFAMEEAAFTRMIEALTLPESLRAARPDRNGRRIADIAPGGYAVVPIQGLMEYRLSWLSMIFGGTSTFDLTETIREHRTNKDVDGVVLHVDSPGGEVTGMQELAEEIRRTAQTKPVIAIVDGISASAAYSATSQASEIWASPSSEVGSIGVFMVHFDRSGALEQAGVKPTLISAGKFKTEGTSLEPLSDAAHAELQRRVNEVYAQFVTDVARGRRVSGARVREQYGEGRVVSAGEALRRGMLDRVISYHDGMAIMPGAMQARANRLTASSTPARSADYFRSRLAIAHARGRAHGVK